MQSVAQNIANAWLLVFTMLYICQWIAFLANAASINELGFHSRILKMPDSIVRSCVRSWIMIQFCISVKSEIFSEQDENQSKSSLTTTLRNIFQHLTFKNLKLLDYYNGIQMESLAERDKNSFQNSKKILITKNLIDQFRLKLELSQWLSSMVRSKIKLKHFLTLCQVKRGQG